MPGSVLSSLVGWVASHLVALSLAGFLVAGLAVFGVVDLPGDWGRGERAGTGSRLGADAVPGREHGLPEPAGGTPTGQGTPGHAASAPGSERPPVQGSPPVVPPRQARDATVAVDGFRPYAETVVDQAVGITREDRVQQARRAFWNGDPAGAEAAYLDLIAEHPEDADAFGELGNLYESIGRQDAALDAYFEAGMRLRAAGEDEKVSQIIELLTRNGDPRATELAR